MVRPKKYVPVVLALVAVSAFFVARHSYYSDPAVIRRRLRLLAESASRKESDAGIRLSLKNQRLISLLADSCRFIFPAYDIDLRLSSREAAAKVFRIHSQVSELSARFYDVNIELRGEDMAVIKATAYYRASSRHFGNGRSSDSVEVRITAVKEEGEWLFSRFEQVEILRR